jgi:hypothetical protein
MRVILHYVLLAAVFAVPCRAAEKAAAEDQPDNTPDIADWSVPVTWFVSPAGGEHPRLFLS